MIDSFQGENRWLSNFWDVDVELEGMVFKSVEHAYMAAKTTDMEIRKKIQNMPDAGAVKRFCKTIKLREDWEDIKINVMRSLLIQKFNHPLLKMKLLNTGDCQIIEGNTWGDTFWGVCRGVGQNNLGKLIMEIRGSLRGDTC